MTTSALFVLMLAGWHVSQGVKKFGSMSQSRTPALPRGSENATGLPVNTLAKKYTWVQCRLLAYGNH